MFVPCNSPTETDESAAVTPPIEQSCDFLDRNLPEPKLSPEPTSPNLENGEACSCRRNRNESSASDEELSEGLWLEKFDSENCHLSQIIRRDSLGLAALRLSDGEPNQTTDDNERAEELREAPKLKDEPTIFDENFSLSSDETFANDEDAQASSSTSHVVPVYRSYSDSTVHHAHRNKELKRRKSVHFADTRGYDLEIHIPISHVDDYTVPPRLMEALEKLRARVDAEDEMLMRRRRGGYDTLLRHHSLVLNFQQPFLEPTFQGRVSRQNVCLESISILPNSLSFTGVVRVINLDYEKQVIIRYTTDRWRTYLDIPASYVSSLTRCQQDQFSFHVVISEDVTLSGRAEMAVRFRLPRSNRDFWDNNYGQNYVITCLEHRFNHCDDNMLT